MVAGGERFVRLLLEFRDRVQLILGQVGGRRGAHRLGRVRLGGDHLGVGRSRVDTGILGRRRRGGLGLGRRDLPAPILHERAKRIRDRRRIVARRLAHLTHRAGSSSVKGDMSTRKVVGTTRAGDECAPGRGRRSTPPRIVARQARNIERSKRVEGAPKVKESSSSHLCDRDRLDSTPSSPSSRLPPLYIVSSSSSSPASSPVNTDRIASSTAAIGSPPGSSAR